MSHRTVQAGQRKEKDQRFPVFRCFDVPRVNGGACPAGHSVGPLRMAVVMMVTNSRTGPCRDGVFVEYLQAFPAR